MSTNNTKKNVLKKNSKPNKITLKKRMVALIKVMVDTLKLIGSNPSTSFLNIQHELLRILNNYN